LANMNYGSDVIRAISDLATFFAERTPSPERLLMLSSVAGKPRSEWNAAKSIFDQSRSQYRSANGCHAIEAQCQFESMCAKTLYNLSGAPAPFDADSPYWIVPMALKLATVLNIEQQEVIDIVVG
ncbi:hypothetical protein O4G98_20905, partial [Zoogloeaceae bacterium G21618-S1]|nr:hypothetical protein [Zoogloeaceae bacterium G21618-S1]